MTRDDVIKLLDDSGLKNTYMYVQVPGWSNVGKMSNKGYAFVVCFASAVSIYRAALRGLRASDTSQKQLDVSIADSQEILL
eukprot:CAMPEP_0176137950 /NCGR_PEP_ID=MMETSP0120_2-20121206/70055_1 /TAXON_ID=160619 /ORGANISM="Kryptoperidinium foliaceum, Strain CCMP 1326" /LENGTH=80 /DNA_ID=CAMNT_0017473843 /DNA_START=33 /DNA_END=275 /DNA_ORIENTATION=+